MSYADCLQNLSFLPNRYSTLGLECNPFPSIPVFSIFATQRHACSKRLFQRQFRCFTEFLIQSKRKRGARVFFVNGERGSGKSTFLYELSNINDPYFFPVFVQAFTTGGFSDLLDRYLEWMGFRGYVSNILTVLETLGIDLEKEVLAYNRRKAWEHVISRIEALGENVESARRIFQVITDFEDGFCRLFKTSKKPEIFATLVNLLGKTTGKRPIVIVDNLENRWEAMPGHGYTFMEKLNEFDNATHFKCNFVFSSALPVGNSMEKNMGSSSLCRISAYRRLIRGARYYRTFMPRLTVNSAQIVISEYLIRARHGGKIWSNEIDPFNLRVIKKLVKTTKGNMRQLITCCHDMIEDAAIRNQHKVTCFNIDHVA